MNAVVIFRAGRHRYALPIAHVVAVAPLDGDPQPLPAPQPEVAGLVRVGEALLPVLTVLGASGRMLVVVEARDRRFALRVEDVLGIVRLATVDAIAPAPAGQAQPLVTGIVADALLLDAALLGDRIDGVS